jgi:F-type H+-transporting ATPase subunit gamma
MASMRDIKLRIKSVKSTKQITRAMNLVSSVKLRKAKERFKKNQFFMDAMKEVMGSLSENSMGVDSLYFSNKNKNAKVATIVITSDRGLCGSYNQNIFKEIMRATDPSKENIFFVVGKKGISYAKRVGLVVKESFMGISEEPLYDDAKEIGKSILNMYQKGEIQEVKLIYTSFTSVISQKAETYQLLPVDASTLPKKKKGKMSLMDFDPSEGAVFHYVIPKYINSVIYGAMIESSVGEQGSRMTAMDSATKNADDIIDHLTLKYNRARQAVITKEISEIVAGANAQK